MPEGIESFSCLSMGSSEAQLGLVLIYFISAIPIKVCSSALHVLIKSTVNKTQ